MNDKKRFLTDVAMANLPLPIKTASRVSPDGQLTVATINVTARIMHEFEAHWIDKFMQIIHRHREKIETTSLRDNLHEYQEELNATMVKIDLEYPFFIEKLTPVSKEKNLVRYNCLYSAKIDQVGGPKVLFRIVIPVLTTDPASSPLKPKGLFVQLSNVSIEIESAHNVYPEDLVAVAERHALLPVHSFLTDDDRDYVIQKLHTESKSSVQMVDDIKAELASDRKITWYSIRCSNFSLLHSYSTLVASEKSAWASFGEYAEDLDKEIGI